MSGKKIYTTELKLEVVQKYLNENIGTQRLADEYHIGSKVDVIKWVRAYQLHGEKGLLKENNNYTGDFKVTVIEYMLENGISCLQTAVQFNIASPQTVRNWEKIYHSEGKEALYTRKRGGYRGVKNERKCRNVIQAKEKESLLEEVQRLRIENEYLKKLNALVQERENLKKPTK